MCAKSPCYFATFRFSIHSFNQTTCTRINSLDFGLQQERGPSFPSKHTIVGHDDAIKWKHFPRYWLFVRGIHRSPVNSPHKGQWRWALMCSLICVWINCWVNNREAGDLSCYRAHYNVIVMLSEIMQCLQWLVRGATSPLLTRWGYGTLHKAIDMMTTVQLLW